MFSETLQILCICMKEGPNEKEKHAARRHSPEQDDWNKHLNIVSVDNWFHYLSDTYSFSCRQSIQPRKRLQDINLGFGDQWSESTWSKNNHITLTATGLMLDLIEAPVISTSAVSVDDVRVAGFSLPQVHSNTTLDHTSMLWHRHTLILWLLE